MDYRASRRPKPGMSKHHSGDVHRQKGGDDEIESLCAQLASCKKEVWELRIAYDKQNSEIDDLKTKNKSLIKKNKYPSHQLRSPSQSANHRTRRTMTAF